VTPPPSLLLFSLPLTLLYSPGGQWVVSWELARSEAKALAKELATVLPRERQRDPVHRSGAARMDPLQKPDALRG
jgi:hypothetical protein